MPRFYETVSVDTDVDIDISVNDFFQEMSSNDAEEMFDLLLENGYEPNSLDFSYLIKNRNFLKEFSYQERKDIHNVPL